MNVNLFLTIQALLLYFTNGLNTIHLWLEDLKTNKKGQVQQGVVGALVGVMVSLLIAIVVVMELINSQDQAGWSADANTSWTNLSTNIWVAISLLVIVPIIIGAVIILGYVRRGM